MAKRAKRTRKPRERAQDLTDGTEKLARASRVASWALYEVVERDDDGQLTAEGRRPFSETLLAGGDPIDGAIRKMELLCHHGWPMARLHMKNGDGSPLVAEADSSEDAKKIWILKAKPQCWRLYFYVNQQEPEKPFFLFLLAICKKKQKQSASHSKRARRILDSLGPGGNGRIRFDLPGS
jgi:hypothetical protein